MADKLAIDGGTPILTRDDYQNWPVITDDDRRFVNRGARQRDCGRRDGPAGRGLGEGMGRLRARPSTA